MRQYAAACGSRICRNIEVMPKYVEVRIRRRTLNLARAIFMHDPCTSDARVSDA